MAEVLMLLVVLAQLPAEHRPSDDVLYEMAIKMGLSPSKNHLNQPDDGRRFCKESLRALAEARSIVERSKARGEDLTRTPTARILLAEAADGDALDRLVTRLLQDRIIGEWLCNLHFLCWLDSEQEYRLGPRHVRIYWIVQSLGNVGTPAAQSLLVRLAGDDVFMLSSQRQTALMDACKRVQKPAPELVRFLGSQLTAKNAFRGDILWVLAAARTPEALTIIEDRLASPEFDGEPAFRLYWYERLLPFRTETRVLQHYKRMLQSRLMNDSRVRNSIVQFMFDYQPERWWPAILDRFSPPKPPAWKEASTEALRELLEIAELTKKQDLSPESREGVAKAVKEIKAILAEREKGK